MLAAARNLFFAAINLAVTEMGTSWLAIVVVGSVFGLGCFIVWFRGGMTALRKHWQQKVGQSVVLLFVAWAVVIATATVQMIYLDHVSERDRVEFLSSRIAGLDAYQVQNTFLTEQVKTTKEQLAEAEADLANATLQDQHPIPSPPPQNNGIMTYGQSGGTNIVNSPKYLTIGPSEILSIQSHIPATAQITVLTDVEDAAAENMAQNLINLLQQLHYNNVNTSIGMEMDRSYFKGTHLIYNGGNSFTFEIGDQRVN